MLNGKFFTMYIHNRLATAKQIPHKANCQFMKTDFQKSALHEKGFMLCNANFSSTCPKASKRLCKRAMGMSFKIIEK